MPVYLEINVFKITILLISVFIIKQSKNYECSSGHSLNVSNPQCPEMGFTICQELSTESLNCS